MNMIDIYPEILRATHAEIVKALAEADVTLADPAAFALDVVEWIRKNWGGRTVTRIWWLMDRENKADSDPELPEVAFQRDLVKSLRGRELRAAALSILLTAGRPGPLPCRVAGIAAAAAEEYLTGDLVYIPKAPEIDRVIRDQKVWRRFSSLINIDQVIAETGLAQSQIYTIKRRVQAERAEREQPRLPGV